MHCPPHLLHRTKINFNVSKNLKISDDRTKNLWDLLHRKFLFGGFQSGSRQDLNQKMREIIGLLIVSGFLASNTSMTGEYVIPEYVIPAYWNSRNISLDDRLDSKSSDQFHVD